MLEKSTLFKRLKKLEKKEFDSDSSPISSKITEELLKQARDILSRISQYLPDYTLHNIEHSYRVLENIESILPSTEKLNIIEIKILIYAVFLHDIGMTSDKIEEKLFTDYTKENDANKKEVLFDEYIKKIKKKNILDTNLINDFSQLLKIELSKYTHTDYSEYIRENHVHRSKMKLFLLKKNMNFEYKGVCLLNHIYDVILSHGLDFKDLKDENRYPIEEIISNKKVNVLFISTLLRVGDLLDADISRTPKYVYDFFQFKDKKSESKWEKNLSLVGKQITNYNVSFNYMSTSPEQERDIRRYIELVENQILKTNKVLKYSSKKLNLSPIINLTVRNNGSYKSADKKITIEYDKVKKILMGLELYDNETMFLRELIQNARDACKLREFHCKKLNIEYTPKILISYDEEERLLVVQDNGIGMDDEKINNFFIKIGNSSYSDENFYEKYKFHPIGHFGIGIFSAFMASNEIDVNSIRFKEDGFFDKPVNIKLKIDEKYVIDLETDKNVHDGTRISMRLNDSVKKLDKEFIVQKIKDTVSDFFDVPIYFDNEILYKKKDIKESVNNDEIYLNRPNYTLKIKFDTRKDNTIIFNKTESEGIKLSYNGISIIKSQLHQPLKYLSDFLNFNQGIIEIRGCVNLALKASRDDIIADNESKKLFNEINNDLFQAIIEKKKENYLTKNISFPSIYDTKVKESFLKHIKFKVYTNNIFEYKTILELLENYNCIYILKQRHIKSTKISRLNIDEKSIIIIDNNKYITSINGILNQYITSKETLLVSNEILCEKIELDYQKEDNFDYEDFLDQIFINFNKKKIFLLANKNSPLRYSINKNHKIGKILYTNRDTLSLKYIFELINGQNIKVNKKLFKKYKKDISKIYIGNFTHNIDSKKHIKHINKRLKALCKEIGIPTYKITKKDFLKSVLKLKSAK